MDPGGGVSGYNLGGVGQSGYNLGGGGQSGYNPGGGGGEGGSCGMVDQCCNMADQGCCVGGEEPRQQQQCYTVWETKCQYTNKPRCRKTTREHCQRHPIKSCRRVTETKNIVGILLAALRSIVSPSKLGLDNLRVKPCVGCSTEEMHSPD